MIVNLTVVDEMLQSAIHLVEGKNLNSEVDFFVHRIPTTENLLLFLKDHLLSSLTEDSGIQLYQLRLHESENLWVDWKAL